MNRPWNNSLIISCIPKHQLCNWFVEIFAQNMELSVKKFGGVEKSVSDYYRLKRGGGGKALKGQCHHFEQGIQRQPRPY